MYRTMLCQAWQAGHLGHDHADQSVAGLHGDEVLVGQNYDMGKYILGQQLT